MATKRTTDAGELADRVHSEVPALLAEDRLKALSEAMMFVGLRLHDGAPLAAPGNQLHLVVDACLKQAQHLPLQARQALIRQVTDTFDEWERLTGRPWKEVRQLLMDRVASLPIASLADTVTPHGPTFVHIVTDQMAPLGLTERGYFIDRLLHSPPSDANDHSEYLYNIACLLPLMPPPPIVDRFAKIVARAASLPPDQTYRKYVLDKLSADLAILPLPPEHIGAAIALLAQHAPLVIEVRGRLRQFLANLSLKVRLAPSEMRAELERMIEWAPSSQVRQPSQP
ncbi:hypothetical protein [Xylophilus sp. GOD-11R]|uniref:hypothetical protein n=1 Tax=Xylophilus sp. GOD-11R TaxID=3089814 RepID=UPI00298C14DC|nr:hypothetical protein [Xylophilus sp. GOD-11R]WPB56760.1 hypothetical protein R9X41_21905 [Xylophilus sp. GOD-11R]